MPLEDFLQQIQPSLTKLAALFALLVLFIKLFWFFFSYENNLRTQNIARLQELVSREAEIQIVKPLQDELRSSIELGYKYAVSLFYPREYNSQTNQYENRLIENDSATIDSIVSKNAEDIITNLSGQAITQRTGQDLFIYLENRYQKTGKQIRKYDLIKSYCKKTWIACLLLAIFCIVGICILVAPNAPTSFFNFWAYISLSTGVYGLYSIICLFHHQKLINDDWEKLKIYGSE